jgi:muramoyltetrapeptide carboxypeptidase
MSNITIPPYLKPGDTVGITCPAGYMPAEKAKMCIDTLQEWGLRVEVGKTLGSTSTNYFSGTDEERRNELQSMLDNKQINAILFGRGGYGTSRIIDDLNFRKFAKDPKWLIGFSDITVLHNHLLFAYHIASMHAPMASAFNEGTDNPYITSLRDALFGKKLSYNCPSHQLNRNGTATGELVGGNLALLAHLIGSKSEIKSKNKILFLEDIGEYIYNVDRMLTQLKRSKKLNKLAGLVIGGFTDMKDTDRPFGKTVDQVIRDISEEFDFPLCYNFPVSHGKENVALKVGLTYTLEVNDQGSRLQECD